MFLVLGIVLFLCIYFWFLIIEVIIGGIMIMLVLEILKLNVVNVIIDSVCKKIIVFVV